MKVASAEPSAGAGLVFVDQAMLAVASGCESRRLRPKPCDQVIAEPQTSRLGYMPTTLSGSLLLADGYDHQICHIRS